jgi:hypothetical protein
MTKYILKGDYPLKLGGKHRRPGETVELDAAVAAPLVASGRLAPESPTDAPSQPAAPPADEDRAGVKSDGTKDKGFSKNRKDK